MRRLVAEWSLGPLVIAFFWPPFKPKPPRPRVLPPVPMEDEQTPAVAVKPITKAEEMP